MTRPSTILLIRPKHFGFNPETAGSNAFQSRSAGDASAVAAKAINEFEIFRKRLLSEGVNVLVFEDTSEPVKPDAVFPNNWVSFHPDGTVILYPMMSTNRRHERRHDVIDALKKDFIVKQVIDLSVYEEDNRYLEGTGSIVFDHPNKTAYACVSPRTDVELLAEVCSILHYQPVVFVAADHGGHAIYHTNVMMCIGNGFCVICLDSIPDADERRMVRSKLANSGNEIVPITLSQMNHFAGNVLSVQGSHKQLLVMSQAAYDSLADEQRFRLQAYCELLPVDINTIETIGGGSARCMMAEVLLPVKTS